ncbi:MAG: hypothetical protein M1823_005442 [Watsoniomyces obsoletus]|nr:MAG: hypothetical protein M1823_005442 [Watsoniomyces obsoletus]
MQSTPSRVRIKKLGKAASMAMTENIILKRNIEDLTVANSNRQKRQALDQSILFRGRLITTEEVARIRKEEEERKARDGAKKAKRAEKQANRSTSNRSNATAEVPDSQEQGQHASAAVAAVPWEEFGSLRGPARWPVNYVTRYVQLKTRRAHTVPNANHPPFRRPSLRRLPSQWGLQNFIQARHLESSDAVNSVQPPNSITSSLKPAVTMRRWFSRFRTRNSYPDRMTIDGEERRTCQLIVHWDVYQVLATEFSSPPSLGTIGTITGNEVNAFCGSCLHYMRFRWPETGPRILGVVEAAFVHGDAAAFDHTLVKAVGTQKTLDEVCDRLIWLTEVFRTRSPYRLAQSTAVATRRSDDVWEISPQPLMPIAEGLCWYHLMDGWVIANGFSIPERHGQLGLELPFPVMLCLAGIYYAVMDETNRTYLRGDTMVLLPTRRFSPSTSSRDGGVPSIQWHLERSPLGNDEECAAMMSQQRRRRQWVAGHIDSFQDARTFLGYYPDASLDVPSHPHVTSARLPVCRPHTPIINTAFPSNPMCSGADRARLVSLRYTVP